MEKLSVCGSYNTAAPEKLHGTGQPVSRTLPSGSRFPTKGVPEGWWTVGLKLPVAGSYNSALAKRFGSPVNPPAIKTLPSGNSVAEWPHRGAVILPVGLKVPATDRITRRSRKLHSGRTRVRPQR